MRLDYSNPIHLDDVAIDFPDAPTTIAHPSLPWQDEALSVARHKPNVCIDLSGWSPEYFPLITSECWLKDFEVAGFKYEVKPLILKESVIKILGLTS